jgi:hypothetical protein
MKGYTDLGSVFWQTVYPIVRFASRNKDQRELTAPRQEFYLEFKMPCPISGKRFC